MQRRADETLNSSSKTNLPTHILFDFFGTLVHYCSSHIAAQGHEQSFRLLQAAGADFSYEGFLSHWQAIFAEFNEAAEQSHHEFSLIELASAFLHRTLGEARKPLVHDFTQTYISEWNQGVCYLDGLSEMLKRLYQRFTLAVITNTHDPDLVPNHLACMGVSSLFSCVVTSVELRVRKPAPGIFSHTLGLLQVPPEQCLYVGDNYHADYLGATSAGIKALLIDPSRHTPVAHETRLESILNLEYRLDTL
ncbi:MAG: hypothetical protein ETSY1_27625 [Candidatus Entotheonella factor]|uniref:Haloacid dehalogenase n=1 Tax=Entotheonella factor TaxID=1429438 RepID=W4LFS0_ENTF1|nr:HAD family hydrolase [Candidatus Entotheonella palauensis]ETW96186.1 MAG: hypothetical protein ETSY1_27625 [Candidatus Entotheonella factor]